MHGVCLYVPTTSFAAVALRCAWNISAPPPAVGAGPPGPVRAAVAGWGAGRVIFFFQYDLVFLCFNKNACLLLDLGV